MFDEVDKIVNDIHILENDLGTDTITITGPDDSCPVYRIQIGRDYEYLVHIDGTIFIAVVGDSDYLDTFHTVDEAARFMSAITNRFHSIDYCHCSRPIYTHEGGFSRGLCQNCDTVRCDAYPEDCPYH